MPTDDVAAVVDALSAAGIPYMLVGSLAVNYYGVPRATEDADFVVRLERGGLASRRELLAPRFRLDPQSSFETITGTTRYLLESAETGLRVELFLLGDDAHDQQRFARRIAVRLFGRDVYLPTVEDLIVTKVRWSYHAGRSKDREDLRNVIAVRAQEIDWPYVEAWCERHGTLALLNEIRASVR